MNVDTWPNSGAVLDGNYFHSSIDGIRWKSSNGRITNNRWEPAVSLTGLEVTPLRSYYEGPFGISNVTISGNVFVGGSPKLITECTGMSHHTKPGVWVSCTDIKITNNSFPPLRGVEDRTGNPACGPQPRPSAASLRTDSLGYRTGTLREVEH